MEPLFPFPLGLWIHTFPVSSRPFTLEFPRSGSKKWERANVLFYDFWTYRRWKFEPRSGIGISGFGLIKIEACFSSCFLYLSNPNTIYVRFISLLCFLRLFFGLIENQVKDFAVRRLDWKESETESMKKARLKGEERRYSTEVRKVQSEGTLRKKYRFRAKPLDWG